MNQVHYFYSNNSRLSTGILQIQSNSYLECPMLHPASCMVAAWRYNIGGGDITVSPFTCQVKSNFSKKKKKDFDPQSTPLRSTNHREEIMSRGTITESDCH